MMSRASGRGAGDPFRGRGYIVTGAASGIGLATARALRARGARLVLWDRDPALSATARALDALPLTLDVAQPEAVARALAASLARLGALHGVVHAAGLLRTGLFEQIPLAAHQQLVAVNLGGTIAVAHAALPHLRATGGSLVLLGSASAFRGPPDFASYAATKAGVLGLAEALRVELARAGVHIGIANPLFVETPMLDGHNRRARFVERFGTVHTADEVARALLRGIERRQFLIWPGWRPRAVFWLSRYGSALAHPLMRALWR